MRRPPDLASDAVVHPGDMLQPFDPPLSQHRLAAEADAVTAGDGDISAAQLLAEGVERGAADELQRLLQILRSGAVGLRRRGHGPRFTQEAVARAAVQRQRSPQAQPDLLQPPPK